MDEKLVSIIVPVYNVEKYIDECIDSLCRQTHKNLELILIDDGSSDHSLEKCLAWREQDDRIIVVSKKNEKQGPTRDLGIRMATGEYLAFVDSDDYVEPDYIEELYREIKHNNADIAFCDMDYIFQKNSEHRLRRCKVNLREPQKPEQAPWLINATDSSLCNKLYRTDFWKGLNIKQSSICTEDVCILFVLLAKARLIVQVKQNLYHYRENFKSTTHGEQIAELLCNSFDVIKDNIEKYNINPVFFPYIKRLMSGIIPVNAFSVSMEEHRLDLLKGKFEEFFTEEGDIAAEKCAAFGSFSLRCILKEYLYFIPDSYSFSSLISAMSKKSELTDEIVFSIKNQFRLFSIDCDIQKTFIKNIKQYKYIFLDFMEERYDIIRLDTECYITKSDAFNEAKLLKIPSYEEITNDSIEYWNLWKEACLSFIKLLNSYNQNVHVILVRSRMTERFGQYEAEESFSDIESIRKLNEKIYKKEEFFLDNFHCDVVLEVEQENFFTDKEFPYGRFPWHVNNCWYAKMGRQLGKNLETLLNI